MRRRPVDPHPSPHRRFLKVATHPFHAEAFLQCHNLAFGQYDPILRHCRFRDCR